MPRAKINLLTEMTAADLRKLAKDKERLEKLEGQKAAIAKDLAQVDKEIAKLLVSLTGRKPTRKKAGRKKVAKKRVVKAATKKKAPVKRKTGKKVVAKKAAKKRVAKKATTKAPRVTVESVVVDLLKGSKEPMAFQDILSTIQDKKLIKSKSKNFANVLRRTLSTSKKVKRVARGTYKA